MGEKRRAVHSQEPAEGEVEDVEAPGVERAVHPDEPAEGGEDEVDEPDAERPGHAA